MDQRDSHCPYSLSSEITAKPTVLGFVLVCLCVTMLYIFSLTALVLLKILLHTSFIFGICLVSTILNVHTYATAGQEDPFELDSNLLLSSGRHGEDRKRQYFFVRPWNTATWRFGWLTVLALPFYSISKTHSSHFTLLLNFLLFG